MNKVLVILGPTAIGKTDLALSLAKKFDGELVACDSRQVYNGLDIGTGKKPDQKSKIKDRKFIDHWEINGVKIWMYDVANLKTQFTVKDYVDQASGILEDILQRGNLPIIVGGTGLYLKALLEGLPNLEIPVDEKLRGELEGMTLEELQNKLRALSPTKWEKLNNSDRQNKRRLLRSIELVTMNPYRHKSQISNLKSQNLDILKIGLTAPRQVLYEKINFRVFSWLGQGILDEVRKILKSGVDEKKFRELGLEYEVAVEYLKGDISEAGMVEKMQIKVRQYAKRQLTWFKKEPDVLWFDISASGMADQVENEVDIWYHAEDDQKG